MSTTQTTPARSVPPAPSAPPAQRPSSRPEPAPRGGRSVLLGAIGEPAGQRIVLYGPGGIGKTTTACLAPAPLAFFDLDDSLAILRPQLPPDVQRGLNRVACESTWSAMREMLHMPGWDQIRTIVIDSATRAEELAVEQTLATVPKANGQRARNVEDYDYGKGYSHVFDTFLTLLGDLDQHTRAGRNVILICHDCTASVPNPTGEDWLRYEPRLQSPASGKASIRLRVREWADHVLFLGYDVAVNDGVGRSKGSRTLYPSEQPWCMAKSRTISKELVLQKFDSTLWNTLFGDQHASQS